MQSLALFLCALALREVEHECQGLGPGVPNHRGSDQHGHAAAIATEVLLFKDFAGAARSELRHRSFADGLPFGRRQLCPLESSRADVVTRVPDHLEKGVIGLEDLAVKSRDQHPYNIGVHKAPDLRFALLDLTIQTAVFERNRGRRGEYI